MSLSHVMTAEELEEFFKQFAKYENGNGELD